MADLILAKLALWGTDIDTFELAASRSDSDGTLSAMLVPHEDNTLQILLTHEGGYPVYLLSYSSVPAEMFSDPRLDDILVDIEETRPANVTVRRQGEGELETSMWIYEEGFDRQSLNLAVSEMSVVRRILSRRLQALAGTAHDAPLAPPPPAIPEAETPVEETEPPKVALEPEPSPLPEPEPVQPSPAKEPALELDPVALDRPVESTSQGGAGRARRGGSLPLASTGPSIPRPDRPEPPPEPPPPQPVVLAPPSPAAPPAFDPFAPTVPTAPNFDPFAPKEPAKPNFDPFAARSGPKQGPATIFPGGKQPMKVLPTVLPGLSAKPETAAAQTPASDTKNCPNCNGELRAKARFCTWCGQRF